MLVSPDFCIIKPLQTSQIIGANPYFSEYTNYSIPITLDVIYVHEKNG